MRVSDRLIELSEIEYREDNDLCLKCGARLQVYHGGDTECPNCDYTLIWGDYGEI